MSVRDPAVAPQIANPLSAIRAGLPLSEKDSRPDRMSRRQVMPSVPKIVSIKDLLGPVRPGDDEKIAVAEKPADEKTSLTTDTPEVPWADDQAPSGLPTLGDKLIGGEVAINLPVLMRSRMLITASSGAGKSWAVRRLIEQTAPMVQQLIIDPEGEFETQAHWRHVMVVIDEAHLFAPQQDKSPAKGACVELAGRGRKRGLCPVLSTQRFSMLNKSVAAELQNRMIGLTILDRDLKRAADELGMPQRQAAALLSTFEPGNFFVYGPALTRTVHRMMVGPVITTHGVNLGDVKPPTVPSADIMDAIFTASEKKDEDTKSDTDAAQTKEDHEAVRIEIGRRRADLLMPIAQAQDPTAKAAAVKAAAEIAGVTAAAIYQWLTKFDPQRPVESMMPLRVPRTAVAAFAHSTRTASPPAPTDAISKTLPTKRKEMAAPVAAMTTKAKKTDAKRPSKTGKLVATSRGKQTNRAPASPSRRQPEKRDRRQVGARARA